VTNRIINAGGIMYYVKGTQKISSVDVKGTEYWKGQWGVDHVLKNADTYYFCNEILIAEYYDT
jgi:hypothetical protein